MNVSLFPLPVQEVLSGFGWVVSRFQALRQDESAEVCDLGEDSGIVESFFARIEAGDVAKLAVSGGALLGDDGFGMVCSYLTVSQVREVSELLSYLDLRQVMGAAPEVLEGVIRGRIPEGYLDDLKSTLIDLWKIYETASRGDMCIVQIYEG
ncbi:hypothetical protein [Streptomyces sp. SID12501]|uniref:DUF1877 family protein n=1 Tax=Streptomyces sp. SID12501 TaxID=2706042 RepID=A0A6B3BQ36_9ACTN|nr:hypothetical protein [Streptomyces sp. SID12501]NEC86477.1 hypothetical protein [Streptomyces sp. SID12501]